MNNHKHLSLYAIAMAGVLALVFGWTLAGRASAESAASPALSPDCALGWYVVPSPDSGSGNNYITSVDALASNDAWAVGYSQNGTSTDTLTMHWDGNAWTIFPSPNLGTYNDLTGVSMVGHSDVWAVGNYHNASPSGPFLYTLHWTGSTWTNEPNPNPGFNYAENLKAVAAVASNDVWAVGFYREYSPQALIMHWDGSSWSVSPNPPGIVQLNGVAALAANDVWAVGANVSQTGYPSVVFHWDGNSWTAPSVPDIGMLYGVSGSASGDVWAVGSNAALHLAGNTWSQVAIPGAGNLYGVAAVSANDAWAVGDHFAHWDGSQWSITGTPPGTLNAISALSSTEIWAGGSYSGGGPQQTLLMRYSTAGPCTTPTVTPTGGTNTPTYTSTPTATPTRFADLTGSALWLSTCPTQTLQLTTHLDIAPGYGIGSTTMRLRNNSGDYRDFSVPPLNYHPYANTYIYNCAVGPCIPDSWSASLPFTLTVDVLDQVQEYNESNNDSYQDNPPPNCGPTGTVTTTPTGTPYTATPTLTETPGSPTSTPTVTSTPTECAISFSDVQPSDYFYTDVQCVYCLGAVSGYTDGTFRPFNNTTRGQMTKIIVVALRMPIVTPTGTATPTFSDVPADSPFYAYVETAAANQVVSGYADGTFRPNANVTRGQLSKIVVVAAGRMFGWQIINPATPSFTDVPQSSPFYAYVETAVCHQVISGYADQTFRPGNNAIRAQIAKIVCRTAQNIPSSCQPGGQ